MGAGGVKSGYDAVRRSGDTMTGNLETPGLTVGPGDLMYLVNGAGVARITSASQLIASSANFSDTSTTRTNLDVYSKAESDNLAAQSALRYYFNEPASDIASFESFATAPVSVQASETWVIQTTSTLVDQWVTPVGTPHLTTLVTGVYEVVGYMSKTGPGTIYTTMELWSCATDGSSPSFIATSSSSSISGTVDKAVGIVNFTLSIPVSLVDTNRLIVKLYAYRVGVGGLTLWYGGNTNAYFGVPISPRNFMRVDGSNAGDVVFPEDLSVTGTVHTQNLSIEGSGFTATAACGIGANPAVGVALNVGGNISATSLTISTPQTITVPIYVLAKKDTTQTFPGGGAVATITFATVIEDTVSAWDGSQLTAPASGIYSISGCCVVATSTAGVGSTVRIYKNGTILDPYRLFWSSTLGAGTTAQFKFSCIVSLSLGDKLAIYLRNDESAGMSAAADYSIIEIVQLFKRP